MGKVDRTKKLNPENTVCLLALIFTGFENEI